MSKEMNNKIVKVKEESKKIPKQDVIKAAEVVVVGILSGVLGYKFGKMTKGIKTLKTANKALSNHIDALNTQLGVLNAAASEGLYEEAIATVTRKLNYVTDQVASYTKRISSNPNDLDAQRALIKYQNKLSVLADRKKSFQEAQKLYEIIED